MPWRRDSHTLTLSLDHHFRQLIERHCDLLIGFSEKTKLGDLGKNDWLTPTVSNLGIDILGDTKVSANEWVVPPPPAIQECF